jgi:RNA polymerase sigma factor (sigma-70 family)
MFNGAAKMQDTTTEIELLRASLAGSKDAFGRIVERYQPLICAITYTATGDFGRSRELAQETFIRAYKSLAQLRDLEKFRAYLCRIARNLVSKSIRQQRFDVIRDAHPLEDAASLRSPEPDPSEIAISKEHQALVWQAIEGIPEQYREPIVLYYRRRRSIAQVADDLELSHDAVKQRLLRGRKLLKTEIASLVEDVLTKTAPGKAFTVAVVAALPALAPQTAAPAGMAALAAKGPPAAKTLLAAGLCGAVLGPVLGLLGGIVGTWASVANTRSPRERTFMLKASAVFWLAMILLLGVPLVLALTDVIPKWSYWVSFAAFFALLAPYAVWSNRRQMRIQIEQGTYVKPQHQAGPTHLSKGAIYGAFAGGIFGGVTWILPTSFMAKDWPAAAITLAAAALIFLVSTTLCLRDQSRRWGILVWTLIALCTLNLAVVNIRWNLWKQALKQTPGFTPPTSLSRWTINLAIASIIAVLLLICLRLNSRRREQTAEIHPQSF